jgi:hypothetical protein
VHHLDAMAVGDTHGRVGLPSASTARWTQALIAISAALHDMLMEATVPTTHRWIPKGMTVSYLQKATTSLRATARVDVPDFRAFTGGTEFVVRVSYNRFHTTAMCSPTRASLLTGRNHHEIGNGQIAELANDWDGYAGNIPRSSALVAEVLKDYGYSTGAWGKWHNTPAEDTTAAGPFEDWPTGLGFEYFYGFLAGEASQYEPHLVRNTTVVAPPKTPEEGYHLSEDLADDAINWLRNHKALQADRPFFMYSVRGCRGCQDCRRASTIGRPTSTGGSSITSTRIGLKPTTWRTSCPTSSRRCANCSQSKPRGTQFSRSAVASGC